MLVSNERKKVLKKFAASLGLKFRNIELLNRAMCHTSYAADLNEGRKESYERLEFLGDAVLKLTVSDILYNLYEDKMEGALTEQRAIIVADKTIARLAKKIDLPPLILTGKCEGEEGKHKESILACAFEAFLGAIYLEYKEKGYRKAKEFLISNFKDDILNIEISNPKAKLQELTQKYNHNLPEYVTLDEQGPAHKKMFTVGVYYENKFIEKATAPTKKEAETEAARKALVKLREQIKEDDV